MPKCYRYPDIGAILSFMLVVMLCQACGSEGGGTAPAPNPGIGLIDCDLGESVSGIDVSVHQGAVDFNAVAAAGRSFAFIRVSDSLVRIDPLFERNWAAAGSAGLIRGPYQYFRPNQDPLEQARLFINKVGRLGTDDLPPVLDLEIGGDMSDEQIISRAQQWLDAVAHGTGKRPIIYTNNGFINTLVGRSTLRDYPLWIAHYTTLCPRIPDVWPDWTFWQSSNTGRVAGIDGPVDLNHFRGSLADLKAFARSTTLY